MNDEELVSMTPWWRGFKGEIKMTAPNKYDVTGIANKVNETTVEITELPIHHWTGAFKAQLEAMMTNEKGDGAGPVKVSLPSLFVRVLSHALNRTTKSTMQITMFTL
jgi:DNA topoisomerase II